MKRRTAYLLVCVFLLLTVGGCGSSNAGFTVRYDITGPVENLDPQFATDTTARLILGNLYEGLVVKGADGEVRPGAAESWTVSADGLTYTFTLREGVCWSDGAPLTTTDFLFTFQRLFNPDAPSPHASSYLCIENAAQILTGATDFSQLGVTVPDDRTIIFQLSYASPLFLEQLAATPASPCNQQAFQGARGRYGLERAYVYSNGPFSLSSWNNESAIQIKQNAAYISETPVLAAGVAFYIGRGDPVQQFLSGKSDLVAAPYEQLSFFEGRGASLQSFDKSTWCIVFNQGDVALGNPLIRQSLAHTVDTMELQNIITSNFTATRTLVPPAILMGSTSYRELTGDQSPIGFDTERGAYLFELGLDSLELEQLPSLTLLVPEEGDHHQYMGDLQQDWQKYLGAYIHLETVAEAAVPQRLRSGSYQMLLMPFSSATGTVDSLLSCFSSASGENHTGYRNARYDSILAEASSSASLPEAADRYAQAEALLLSDVVVLPVYCETTTYAMAERVSGITISPFAGHISFKEAQKS